MRTTGTKRKLFLYSLLGLVVFVIAFWLQFPYGEVERLVEDKLAAGGIEVDIKGLEPGTPLSYTVDSVEVTRLRGRPLGLQLGSTTAHISLLGLLSGDLEVEVSSRSFGGFLEIAATLPDPDGVEVAWRDIDLAAVSTVIQKDIPPVTGRATGRASLELPLQTPSKAQGDMRSELVGVVVGPGTVNGIPLPRIELGTGAVAAQSKSGRLRIFDTALRGGDIEVSAEGTVALGASLERSTLDANVVLSPTQEAKKELSLLFSLLESSRKPDGTYTANLKGTVAFPYLQNR